MQTPINRAIPRPIPVLCAAPMNLYPTMNNVQEVIELAESKLPIVSKNDLFSLLMVYHNTLIQQMKEGK